MMSTNGTDPGAAPQRDLRLLEGNVAKRLLFSTIPARLAYVSRWAPRVIAT
jgi:hypothetical protein